MADIRFDTGLVTYSLNGACDVMFNPTDTTFVEHLYSVFDALDKKQDEYQAELEKTGGTREVFDIAQKRNAEMRGMIDDILGDGVCDSLFGEMNVYALADGLPVWANLMLAIMDEVDTTFSREQKRTNPRINKYVSRWAKK